jgi:TonB family protein
MPRRFLPQIAAGALCVLLSSGRLIGETTGSAADPIEGIDTAYQKKTGETHYYPWFDRWPPANIDIYPIIVRPDSGTKHLLLRVVLRDVADRKMRGFEMTIDGESANLDLNESGKAKVDSRGCRPTAEVDLPGQEDLVRRIAAASDVEAAYGEGKKKLAYRFVPEDLERFRRVLALYDKDDLPPARVYFEGKVKPGRPADPMKEGDSHPEAIPASRVAPEYPREARGKNIQAMVVLGAQVLRDGSVGKARILRPAGGACGFEEAALAAIKQWKYVPGKMKGQSVDVNFTISIDFSTQVQDPFMKAIESRDRRPRDRPRP